MLNNKSSFFIFVAAFDRYILYTYTYIYKLRLNSKYFFQCLEPASQQKQNK